MTVRFGETRLRSAVLARSAVELGLKSTLLTGWVLVVCLKRVLLRAATQGHEWKPTASSLVLRRGDVMNHQVNDNEANSFLQESRLKLPLAT